LKPKPRILILSPSTLPSVTGNALTAERWRRALEEKGWTVQVLAARGLEILNLKKTIDFFRPDLIHAHHAFQSGCRLLDLPFMDAGGKIPFVVSPAGTDINKDLKAAPRREAIFRVFESARAIIAQGPGTLERLKEVLPSSDGHIFPVPKSILWFGEDDCRLRDLAGCLRGDVLFFLPAGVRPVKGNLECLTALEKVHASRPRVRVVFAGPGLDPVYTERFAMEVRRCAAFACWIPLIPPAAMRSAYKAADVVLNASFSEGLANALLEGMAAGRPLLASDILGNRGPVSGREGEEPSGYLFDPRDPEDFIRKALRLIDDENLRISLGQAGKRRAAQWPGPEDEADGLIRAYEFARRSS
jgi:glycosyltransferase involved in cell wall biosynthesis